MNHFKIFIFIMDNLLFQVNLLITYLFYSDLEWDPIFTSMYLILLLDFLKFLLM
jgi:hypothetical protein